MNYFNTQPKQLLEAAHLVLSMDNGYMFPHNNVDFALILSEEAGSLEKSIWKRIIFVLMKPFNPFIDLIWLSKYARNIVIKRD